MPSLPAVAEVLLAIFANPKCEKVNVRKDGRRLRALQFTAAMQDNLCARTEPVLSALVPRYKALREDLGSNRL